MPSESNVHIDRGRRKHVHRQQFERGVQRGQTYDVTPEHDYDGDTAAIEAALSAASDDHGAVDVHPGEYRIAGKISVPDKVRFSGSGGVDTILRTAEGLDDDLIELAGDWTEVDGFRILGGDSDSGNGIHLTGQTYRLTLRNLLIEDFPGHGITGSSQDGLNYETHMSNVESNGNGGEGFNLKKVADLYSEHCYAERNTNGFVDDTGYNTYIHPHGYDNETNGFNLLSNAERLQIVAPHFETNHRRGMLLKGSEVSISDGVFYRNSQDGAGIYPAIHCDGSSNVRIFGGAATDGQDTPTQQAAVIDVNSASGTQVWGMHASGNTEDPFQLAWGSIHNGVGAEDLGASPTSEPAASWPEGSTVRNSNGDNNETWALVGGSWVQVV